MTADKWRATLGPRVILPGDADYDTARRVYNAMIDRHPAAILRPRSAHEVSTAVRAGAEAGLRVAIRGGGHNAGGLGVCDDGLVIDLCELREIHVDAEARVVRVEGGSTWGEVDRATQPYGLAVPSGILSTTGVGGLTLGGGTGHLTRRYGLTIDNLIGADVVLADGTLVRASEDEQPELFWAIRGGGGNFGVVTAFEFAAREVDTVIAGPTLWPLERAGDVMRWYREFILDAPVELGGFFAFMTVPPAAPFPAELHRHKVCGVVWCWTGSPARADEVLAPVRAERPILDGVRVMPYAALQRAFDDLYPPGLHWYWRADFIDEIPDAAVAHHVCFAEGLPTPQSSMHLYPMDGAVHHVGPRDTAFSHREANWNQVIVGVSPDAADRDRIVNWTRDYHDAVHPYAAGGAYVNFLMGDEGEGRVRATYRDNYPRLEGAKRRYDPDNRLCVNQNIVPGPGPETEAEPPPAP